MEKTAKLIIYGSEYEFPLVVGTEGEVGIDISTLRSRTGAITLDNGLANTGTSKSAITFLDGEKGVLRYRGYKIEDLATKTSFLEVAYLLIYGALPTRTQYEAFKYDITMHTMVNEDIRKYYEVWPQTAHPMSLLASIVAGMSTFFEDSLNQFDARQVDISIHRLIAKMPTVAAWAYKKSIGQPFVYPLNKLSYLENFFNMMFSVPTQPYEINPVLTKALNLLFILHADHEQNCSTASVRLVGSSQSNIFVTVSAGIAALGGPLHGGANQAVLEMLQEILENGGNVQKYVEKAKDKNDPFRLMGFGHRVYKNFDPRAQIIKKTSEAVLKVLGLNDPLLDLAKELEAIALKDEYFIEKKLYPNVDFYSGVIYKAMGFPTNMFTVLFSMARLPGWIAHWKEMIGNKNSRIGRPRQIYIGPGERECLPCDERT